MGTILIFGYNYIKKRLSKIYSLIPNFDCKHCHKCCTPIIWFEPENILIKRFIEQNFGDKNYQNDFNNLQCCFLKNDRCSIYPVRPIVCRLQGNILDLPCNKNKNTYLTQEQVDNIKFEFNSLLKDMKSNDIFYSNRKLT